MKSVEDQELTFQQAFAGLVTTAKCHGIDDARRNAPRRPGLYSIHVDRAEALPPPFSIELKRRKTRLLYIGVASKNLYQRLVRQDLRQRGSSTFFRGIGAILGYRPIVGSLRGMADQRNYKFGQADTSEIIQWIEDHLRVRWVACDPDLLREYEFRLIRILTPLMNARYNPAKSAVLASLRKECREIAKR